MVACGGGGMGALLSHLVTQVAVVSRVTVGVVLHFQSLLL